VWNTTHPSFSNILDSLAIPNIGDSSFSLENNKDLLRKHVKGIGLNVPRSVTAPKNAQEVFKKFGSPWIIKNLSGIRVVKTFNELVEIINDSDDLIVEEFIAGKVVSVHSVSGFRGENIYTFPLGNLPHRQAGALGSFSKEEKEKLSNLAKDLHKHINSKHYLKTDFILNSRGKVYLLQIDGMPDLKIDSHFSQVCEYVGARPHHVIEHMLEQVL
jgi:D-alanine-D-alanine ligase-like ATP-grasp enzyme